MTVVQSLASGAVAGLLYHPIASAVGAGVAGALAGSKRAPRWRIATAVGMLLLAWAAADGFLVLATVADAARLEASGWVFVATWALVGLAAGYLAPLVVGRAVGVRVTHGTGWLSAASIAVTFSLAIGLIARTVASGQ